MRGRDAKKSARLREGEVSIDEAALWVIDDRDFSTLRQLRELDEKVELAGYSPLLEPIDREIIDRSLSHGHIDHSEFEDGRYGNRTTIWRRIRRLLRHAWELDRYGKTLLGTAEPQPVPVIMAMAKVFASGADTDDLSIEGYNRLAEIYRAGAKAHNLLYPPTGISVERRGDTCIITGSGPVPAIFQEAIRSGRAVRIFDPPRCHACGRFLSRPTTGRCPKYCSERCRSRYRRQG